ncbi:hypothetical protein [Pelagibaculum spongiae]|uniref:Uncharacterized protein n=1 Tax=Pelagibaculum spongiae TaxID=2080658 RepID=A0A2V1H579_9GAMM|nr:hypothetical protein [Pelagibaculum spongiae]PVZ72357.1 hypothetical protein DC094_04940 [Pelagibaculum spongiae]
MLLIFMDLDQTMLRSGSLQNHSEPQKACDVKKTSQYGVFGPPYMLEGTMMYWIMHQKLLRLAINNNDNCKIIFVTMAGHTEKKISESMCYFVNYGYRKDHHSKMPTTLDGKVGYDVLNYAHLSSFEKDLAVFNATHWNLKCDDGTINREANFSRHGILKKLGIERYVAKKKLENHAGEEKVEIIVVDDNDSVRDELLRVSRTNISRVEVFDPRLADYNDQLAYIGSKIRYHNRRHGLNEGSIES